MPCIEIDDPGMGKTALELLAASLAALRDHYASSIGKAQAVVAKKAGVDQRTIGRIINRENSTGVDKLDALANVYRVKPWQLLVPGFDPAKPPVLLGQDGFTRKLSEYGVELGLAFDDRTAGLSPDQTHKLFLWLRSQVESGSPARPKPGGSEPDDESRYSRAPDPKKLRGKSRLLP